MSDCKRCGFCCQIHMTKVGPADAELISHRRGFKKIVPHNGGQWAVMKIPCKHLAGKLCRIYSNKRPKLCGTFPEPMFLERLKEAAG